MPRKRGIAMSDPRRAGRPLHPRYHEIMLARLRTSSARTAARELGLPRRTVQYYWYENPKAVKGHPLHPALAKRVRALRGWVNVGQCSQLLGISDGPIDRLWDEMTDQEEGGDLYMPVARLWYPCEAVLAALHRWCTPSEIESQLGSGSTIYYRMKRPEVMTHVRLDTVDRLMCMLGLSLHDIDCDPVYSKGRPGGVLYKTMKEEACS